MSRRPRSVAVYDEFCPPVSAASYCPTESVFSSTIRLWIGVVPVFSTVCVTGPLKNTSPALRSAVFTEPSASTNRAVYGENT